MSAIDTLIAQISDPRLRERLTAEWDNAKKEKKFGLVFETTCPNCYRCTVPNRARAT